MSSDIAISVKNLTKAYRLFNHPGDRIKQALTLGRIKFHKEFTALKDVSFEVKKGETVGIVGRNGSGKSTLLQLICGILKPTSGSVTVNGRISALLELGSGFNPEFTGRENIYFQGAIMGFSQQEMDTRVEDIVAFADIGEHLDQVVKTYSSGMAMRLAFATQMIAEPDILIIDEALSVGDFFFQQKCLDYIHTLCKNGVTLLLVSHDTSTVRDVCSRTIFLETGRLRFIGETRLALRHYLAEQNFSTNKNFILNKREGKFESAEPQEMEVILRDSIWRTPKKLPEDAIGHLVAIAIYDSDGNVTTSFCLGSVMLIKIAYLAPIDGSVHVTVELLNKYNQVVTVLGSSRMGLAPPLLKTNQIIIFEMQVQLLLEAGRYSIVINLGYLAAPNQGVNIDSSDPIGPIQVYWDYQKDLAPFLGMIGLPSEGIFKTLVQDIKFKK